MVAVVDSSVNTDRLKLFDEFSVRVTGECMQPVIADQSFVSLKRQKIYLPGDVVTYRNGLGQLACHRFLGYVLWSHGWRAMTRADDAPQADALSYPGSILGKVTAVDQQTLAVPLRVRLKSVGNWFHFFL